jgi:hypothetical protein
MNRDWTKEDNFEEIKTSRKKRTPREVLHKLISYIPLCSMRPKVGEFLKYAREDREHLKNLKSKDIENDR